MDGERPIVIHLVHGTFDARKPGTPHWCDANGELAQGVKALLPTELQNRVKFEPFDWRGANSFVARSDAAKALAGILEQPGSGLRLLIGHSHGGTVEYASSEPARGRVRRRADGSALARLDLGQDIGIERYPEGNRSAQRSGRSAHGAAVAGRRSVFCDRRGPGDAVVRNEERVRDRHSMGATGRGCSRSFGGGL